MFPIYFINIPQLSYGAAQSSPTQLQLWPLMQQVIKAKLKKEGG